jgi:hypothetical protein
MPKWPTLSIGHVTLPNGVDLLLHTDRKAPIVHLNFRFRVGSKHEKPGQYGLAHLFEHLIYQSRDGTPIATAAEQMGATTLNGTTTEDFTEFYQTIPASRLERMLWMESNCFALFLQNLTQQNLDRQREVGPSPPPKSTSSTTAAGSLTSPPWSLPAISRSRRLSPFRPTCLEAGPAPPRRFQKCLRPLRSTAALCL